MDKVLTVKDLGFEESYEIFKDFEIYVGNRPVHMDEFGVDFYNKRITLRGSLFYESEWKGMTQLKSDIESAFNKFYSTYNS